METSLAQRVGRTDAATIIGGAISVTTDTTALKRFRIQLLSKVFDGFSDQTLF
jgi:hypothetical protein